MQISEAPKFEQLSQVQPKLALPHDLKIVPKQQYHTP